jgi:hypothetical protein
LEGVDSIRFWSNSRRSKISMKLVCYLDYKIA